MPGRHSRLQLATKIHYDLLRELGQGIDVEQMLKGSAYARDVLLVCEALRGTELVELARQFRAPSTLRVAPAKSAADSVAPGHARQPLDWGADTSGFGASELPGQQPRPAAALRQDQLKRSWFARLTGQG